MIITTHVEVKPYGPHKPHYDKLGYETKWGEKIVVPIQHLTPQSHIKIEFKCDQCGVVKRRSWRKFTNLDKHYCYNCSRCSKEEATKRLKHYYGKDHWNHNPNKSEFKSYMSEVRTLTEDNYKKNVDIINPERLPRTLCGIEGGYQLDHKVSVKKGFEKNIPSEMIASIDNLQMLSWEDNRSKW